ncbi:MAG TPA: ABC transporter substrate-binding protein [Candidatus Limnocylindria bacterium]|nr:ABC transporter substrate-binding protein [Candidatus Limnocylindria bacterium]
MAIPHGRGPSATSLGLLLLVLPLLVLAGCLPAGGRGSAASGPTGRTDPSPSPEGPLVVTDDAGRSVTVAGPPSRIVSLAPSNTEIVCALGACDRLVGVTDADDYPPEVTELDRVVVQTSVDIEAVVAAEPDLVLAAGNELTPSEAIEQLERLGLTVVVLYPQTLDELHANIELVGAVIGEGGAAAGLVADLEERTAAVVDAVAGAGRPRTYYEVFYSDAAIYTAGEGSFIAELISLAGGEPVTGDAQGVIDTERIIAADPELILLGAASYDPALADAEGALAAVSARPGWGQLSAVRAGRVVPYLEDVVTTRPGPRIVDGLEALARAIHPDRFGD